MKKITKIMLVALAVMAVACFGFTAFADEAEIGVYVNSNYIEFDVHPTIIEGRTMVPVRAIFEALGADVEWEQETKTVTATRDELVIKLTIGDKAIYVGDEIKELDVPALIIDGRTLVPARAVSEAFGASVQWNAQFKEVYITEYSLGYKQFVSLIKEKGEYTELFEMHYVDYEPSEELLGDSELGLDFYFYILYEENSAYPLIFGIDTTLFEIALYPDCTGKYFNYEFTSDDDFYMGFDECKAISKDKDCVLNYYDEKSIEADMISNIAAYISRFNLYALQEWIEECDSDLKVEDLGFVNYDTRLAPFEEGEDGKCDICDEDAEVLPLICYYLFELADFDFDGEACDEHLEKKLLESIDLDTVVKAVDSVLQFVQQQSEGPIKFALATNENYVVVNILVPSEYIAMMEEAAKEEGFDSFEEVLETQLLADESFVAFEEELPQVKDALEELKQYGVNISFDGIIINICDEEGKIISDIKVDA